MGRRTLVAEVDTLELFKLSYFTLRRALNSKDVPESKKIDIATQIYLKHLPNQIIHSGEVKFSQEQKNDELRNLREMFVLN